MAGHEPPGPAARDLDAGDTLVFDWGEIGPLFVFCAVMAWSRVRFVYFADNLGADSTMTALARSFQILGGVPKTALTDRMDA